MAYQDTIDYLFGLQKQGIKFGLSNSIALMQALGDPHRRFRSIHVAGTNGKGSTSMFLASMLQAAGYRTGLYTSPHLVDFTERIRINGAPISEARVVELAGRVRALAGDLPTPGQDSSAPPTFFEVTTAMAFSCFAEENVEVAVVEAGMGGRLDATNVITPLVSVITNIDLEHTDYLGTTLEQIAGEKAGIIKTGVPVVTGVVQPEAAGVLERTAAKLGAPLYRMPQAFRPEHVAPGRVQRFAYRGIRTELADVAIGMLGRHQVGNACLALAAVECATDRDLIVPEEAQRAGLAQAVWEGRLERVSERPDIYLDGAHNPASAQALAEALAELRPAYRDLVLVIGILKDKDRQGILESLLPLAGKVIVTQPLYARAMDAMTLADEVRRLHRSVETASTVAAAVDRSRALAGRDDLVVITGSLFTVGDARAVLCTERGPGALKGLKG